jgi:hypothetical protein
MDRTQAVTLRRLVSEMSTMADEQTKSICSSSVVEEELRGRLQQLPDDFEWAKERATNMCAAALIDAQVYRQKLLKGFGYPNETFARAQDYRALNIVLEALESLLTLVPRQEQTAGATKPQRLIPGLLERIDILAMLIEQRPQDKADSIARASQIREQVRFARVALAADSQPTSVPLVREGEQTEKEQGDSLHGSTGGGSTGDWKPVFGREDRYEVSSDGRVRKRGGRELKTWPNDLGYQLVRFSKPRATERVHRVVAEAFIPNPDGKPFINHLDCVRSNNRADNLEWCTQAENLQHSENLGRMRRDNMRGRRSPNAALSDDTVREIRNEYSQVGTSWESLAKRHGVSKRAIGHIVRWETYTDVR